MFKTTLLVSMFFSIGEFGVLAARLFVCLSSSVSVSIKVLFSHLPFLVLLDLLVLAALLHHSTCLFLILNLYQILLLPHSLLPVNYQEPYNPVSPHILVQLILLVQKFYLNSTKACVLLNHFIFELSYFVYIYLLVLE